MIITSISNTSLDQCPLFVDHVRRTIAAPLEKFSGILRRVEVSLRMIEDPHTRCDIRLSLASKQLVYVSAESEDPYRAVNRAGAKLRALVCRKLSQRAHLRSRKMTEVEL
jgi:ribosome-associated translation inhibitor RaiA